MARASRRKTPTADAEFSHGAPVVGEDDAFDGARSYTVESYPDEVHLATCWRVRAEHLPKRKVIAYRFTTKLAAQRFAAAKLER